MNQRIVWLLVILAGLAGGLTTGGATADEKSSAKPAADAKPESADSAAERKAADEYYEIMSLLVDTIDQVERNYVQQLSRRELVEAAIQGILHKLDPYSNYIAPDDISRFKTSVESQFGGIGIQVTIDKGTLQVLSPLVGSPAYRAGMQAGDRIVEIEGQSTDGMSIDDAVKALKGEVGTEVTIKVLSPGDSAGRPITLNREMVHVETVLGDVRKTDDLWDYMLDADGKIGYVRLNAFSRDTADELQKVLSELKKQGMRGLILDLRFNPGGLLTSAIDVCDLFLSKGRIVSTSGRNIQEKAWDAKSGSDFEGFPMAVLVNRYSASSSEIVAACLQDHQRAVVIGERTWGKGSVQNVVELEGGKSAIKLTTAGYMRPSGKNIHRFPNATEKDEWGVVPDDGYLVRFSDDELREFVAQRRERDFIQRKEKPAEDVLAVNDQPVEEPASGQSSDENFVDPLPPESTEPAEDSSDDSSQSDPDAGDEADRESAKKSDADASPEADRPDVDQLGDEPSDGDQPDVDQPNLDAEAESPTSGDKPQQAEKKSFSDRQLSKALEYIKSQIDVSTKSK